MKYKFIIMFVPRSPNLTWFALCICQLSYSDKCKRVSSAHERSCDSQSEARPPRALCCSVAWLGHTVMREGWLWFEVIRCSMFYGEKHFVVEIVGKTWPEKCVAQIMYPISRGAICGVCPSQTSPGACGQFCTTIIKQ